MNAEETADGDVKLFASVAGAAETVDEKEDGSEAKSKGSNAASGALSALEPTTAALVVGWGGATRIGLRSSLP